MGAAAHTLPDAVQELRLHLASQSAGFARFLIEAGASSPVIMSRTTILFVYPRLLIRLTRIQRLLFLLLFHSAQERRDLFKDLFPQQCDGKGHCERDDEIEQIRGELSPKHKHRDPLDQIDLQ